jgi:hypothetical protein
MRMRKNDHNHSNIGAFLKCVHAVQQHRLACDPAELLELASTCARSFSAGNNYDADIRLH